MRPDDSRSTDSAAVAAASSSTRLPPALASPAPAVALAPLATAAAPAVLGGRTGSSSAPSRALGRPPPPAWSARNDSPQLQRTLRDLHCFLEGLPLPIHRLVPRLIARAIARALRAQGLMATNIVRAGESGPLA
jgi:hypothetical protein